MIIKKINLNSPIEKANYSKKLKAFENEFSYSLGLSFFKIAHGIEDNNYFSFFENMGMPYYFVAEDKGKIVGAGCAVLRQSEDNLPYWYLCDFKITKAYRGKRILEKMLLKYFVPCILKSHRVVAVNMSSSPMEGNGLLKKIKKIFWFLNINMEWINLHQWNKNSIQNNLEFKDKEIYTNMGSKDIVVEGQNWQLYHILPSNTESESFKKFKSVCLQSINDNSVIMLSVNAKEDTFDKQSLSGTGVIITAGVKNIKINSLEI